MSDFYEDWEEGSGGSVFAMPQPVPQPQVPTRVNNNDLYDVDRRVALANCYRMVLNDSFFDYSDEITSLVEREIRDFVKHRLEVLMGMAKPKIQESGLSLEEVKILKQLVASIQKRSTEPQVTQSAPVVQSPPVPQRRRVVTQPLPPPPPEPVPVVVAPVEPPKPRLKKRKRLNEEHVTSKVSDPLATTPTGTKAKTIMEHITPDGRTVKMDVTGQNRPPPGAPQPLPTYTGRQATHQMQQVASQQALNGSMVTGKDNS